MRGTGTCEICAARVVAASTYKDISDARREIERFRCLTCMRGLLAETPVTTSRRESPEGEGHSLRSARSGKAATMGVVCYYMLEAQCLTLFKRLRCRNNHVVLVITGSLS